MNDISINADTGNIFVLNYENSGSVRCFLDKLGKPWFCLYDVNCILNITNNNVRNEDVYVDRDNINTSIGRYNNPEYKAFVNWINRFVTTYPIKTYGNVTNEILSTEALVQLATRNANLKRNN